MQRKEIAQESWEIYFVTKETEFRSVQTENVHTEKSKKAAQCEHSDSLTQKSRAHHTVTSDTLRAATKTAASSTEHGRKQESATKTKRVSLL